MKFHRPMAHHHATCLHVILSFAVIATTGIHRLSVFKVRGDFTKLLKILQEFTSICRTSPQLLH